MEVTYLDGTLVQSTTEGSASQDIISPHLSVIGKKGKGKTVLASPLCIIEDKLLAYVFSELDSRLVNIVEIILLILDFYNWYH